MKKEQEIFIKEEMKKRGFKSKDTHFFKKVGDNFLFLYFLINEKQGVFITSVNYKKYSHDDLYWKILNEADLLTKKSDSWRIFAVSALRGFHKDIKDESCDKDTILKRMDYISNELTNEILEMDINDLIINGDSNSKSKSLALIDSNRVAEAIELAKTEIAAGHAGGCVISNKSFFQLLVETYSNNPAEDLKGLEDIPWTDMPNPPKNSALPTKENTKKTFVKDKAEWQFESSKKYLSEISFNANDTNYIWNCASNHITMFVVWLALNDCLSEMHYKDKEEIKFISELKDRKISGFDYFKEYFDLTLTVDDIIPKLLPLVDDYYEERYLQEIDKIWEPLVTPFSWEDYDRIEKIISKSMDKNTNNTSNQKNVPKKKWFQFWKK